MTDLTRLANIAEIIGVTIVIGGLYFAMLQMRQIRRQRRELAAIELFRSFGSPQFSAAFRAVLSLPEGLSMAEIKARYPGREDAAMLISTTMENIGVMTFQRIIPFLVVNNLVGASSHVGPRIIVMSLENPSFSSGSNGWRRNLTIVRLVGRRPPMKPIVPGNRET